MKRSYPISLVLEGQNCLVIGGGRIAERKITSLLHAGAGVRVIAAEVVEAVRQLAEDGLIELKIRKYAPDDLDGAFLVIVATNNSELNREISEECRHRGLLVNVVDQPALCSFYVPAVIERGPVNITISTSAASPALSKHLRVILEDVVGEEYGLLSNLMNDLRGEVIAAYDRQEQRAEAWNRLLASDILILLKNNEITRAKAYAREVMELPPSFD